MPVALQEDRAQVHLDAEAGDLGQGAGDDQALVEQRDGRLDDVGLEAARQADRLVGGEHRHADALDEALLTQLLQAVPHGRTLGREQVAGALHHHRVGLVEAQPAQGLAQLVLDVVRPAVGTHGAQDHAERTGPGHQVADQGLGAAELHLGVEHGEAGAGGDLQGVGRLAFGRAAAGRGRRLVQAELGAGQAELGVPVAVRNRRRLGEKGHGVLRPGGAFTRSSGRPKGSWESAAVEGRPGAGPGPGDRRPVRRPSAASRFHVRHARRTY